MRIFQLPANPVLPLWLKIAYTAFVCVLVPAYSMHHGFRNFMWFSNVALLSTTFSLWFEWRLLPSMMTLAVLVPEIVWTVGFLIGLFTGEAPFGLTDYMFDDSHPLFIRALSLYHLILPPLLLWMLWKLGYDRRALRYQTIFALIWLPLTWLATNPDDNVNWTYGLAGEGQEGIHPLLFLVALMIIFPLLIYLPTHLILTRLLHLDRRGTAGR